MGIKFRLIVMNFLQYAVWGAWLITLGTYCASTLHFEGGQIATFFATMGIASLFMPAIMGVLADRFIPAQKLMGICHLLAGGFLALGAMQTAYNSLYIYVLLSVMFYMPTIALSNSVAFNALTKAKMDTVKAFPPIRVWGTVGFIAAMWFVSLVVVDRDFGFSPIGGEPRKELTSAINPDQMKFVPAEGSAKSESVKLTPLKVKLEPAQPAPKIEKDKPTKYTNSLKITRKITVPVTVPVLVEPKEQSVQLKYTPWQLLFSALLSLILAVYSFSLPSCPVNRGAKQQSWIDTFGLRAFSLFKQRKMAIFFIFSMMLGMSLQITNAFADPYITSFGEMAEYADSLIVKQSTILISLSQVSETLCILLIPFFLKRFGIKKVMLISMAAWVLRFGLLGFGNPGAGAWMLVLSMVVYGVAFDFFNISGSLFVDQETSSEIRSSAQGVFMIMTNGFGAFIGSYIAGVVVDAFHFPESWFIFATYSMAVAVAFALIFKYKYNPNEVKA